MTAALLKTLRKPQSVSVTAHSRDKTLLSFFKYQPAGRRVKAAKHYTEQNGNDTIRIFGCWRTIERAFQKDIE